MCEYLLALWRSRQEGWVYCSREDKRQVQARLFRASNYKTSRLRVLLCQSGVVFLVLMLSTAFSGICLAEDSGSASSVPVPEQKNDCANDELKWPLCVSEGPDDLFYFLEAVSGKKFKPKTFDLLHGVTDVTVENNVIVFHRVDKVELRLGHDTERGGKFFEDWEKAKINLEAKFGPSGRDFLDSVDRVHIAGERIEVIRKGAPDLVINLGDRKLHHAFDLRGLRFGRLSMLVSFVTPDQGCVQADVGPTCTGYQYSSSDAGTSPQ